jgi:hypothetical protein
VQTERHGIAATVVSKLIVDAWQTTLQAYRFHYTCPELADVVSETMRRKVGDCTALSNMLAAEFREHGLQARVRGGFLWGGMTGSIHCWVEVVDSDGQWKVLDLSMAMLGRLFAMEEYAEFCFGSLSNRVIPVEDSGNTTVSHRCGGEILEIEPSCNVHSRGCHEAALAVCR